MFLGHYGLAFGIKRRAPSASLGTFAFATQWLDELWPILLLLGVERVRVEPGYMLENPLVFESYPISHSLLMAIVWGVVIGGAYYARRRNRRVAWLVALVVVSHWVLDVPMHAPDLELWPGSRTRVGLGLWNSLAGTLIPELGFFTAGLFLYLRGTRARDRVGAWGLWSMVAALVLIFASGFFAPPPATQRAVALGALTLWLFVPWSAWVDRHRDPA